MKVYICLAVFGIMWLFGQYSLMTKYNMGWEDILLLATFGGGCAGTLVFSMLIGQRKKDEK